MTDRELRDRVEAIAAREREVSREFRKLEAATRAALGAFADSIGGFELAWSALAVEIQNDEREKVVPISASARKKSECSR